MEQLELDKYWSIFNIEVNETKLLRQRQVTLAYCELVASLLDKEGLKALNVIRELTQNKVTERRRSIWKKKMQKRILCHETSAYSVLSWSLESDNISYPPWYAAGIAGLNVVELNIASLHDLGLLAKKVISN